jgi:hypothetical protein
VDHKSQPSWLHESRVPTVNTMYWNVQEKEKKQCKILKNHLLNLSVFV